jgi:hypothetical protein
MDRTSDPAARPTTLDRRSALRALGAAAVAAGAPSLISGAPAAAAGTTPSTGIDWAGPGRTSRTTPTLQVVVNPMIRRGSPIHASVYATLRALRTRYVRFVPWFPYPKLGVAELDAPSAGGTSWDFRLIDPLVEDFVDATRDRSPVLNFSTIPEWMWQPAPWSVPAGSLNVVGGDIGLAAGGTAWADYTFAVDVTARRTGVSGDTTYAQAGWVVRAPNPGNGYAFLLSDYPYASPAAPGYIVFVVFKDGQAVTIRPVALPFAVVDGTRYHVRTTVSGADLTVTVDGTPVMSVHDETFPAGTVGFREFDTESATFDNVVVTAASGETLLTDDFSEGLSQWVPPVAYPADPDAPAFGYSGGRRLAVPVDVVADYYRRLVSWYTAGGFHDEHGVFHRSGHHYTFPYWEVLNEPDAEHNISPQDYNLLYDAIVTAIRQVSPKTKFVGLGLAFESNLDYFRHFLDPANHRPGVPLDLISYHFYATPDPARTVDEWGPDCFAQADRFLAAVGQIEEIRLALAPHVRTTVNEVGTIHPAAATQPDPAPLPDAYWNFSGSIFAYVFARLALLGIDIVGESQLVGYPSQYPSVTMLDWTTGEPNARYRTLELLLAEIRPGHRLVEITGRPASDSLYMLGVRDGGCRKILLVNRTNAAATADIDGLHGAHLRIVDQQSAGGPIRRERVSGSTVTLGGYAVAVATDDSGRRRRTR